MTEDQQQGLKQIRERTERLKIGREPVDEGEVDRVYENTISDLLKDIDFLLSIVKGQEAIVQACVCGHPKSTHELFSDHDECLGCRALDEPCSEFRLLVKLVANGSTEASQLVCDWRDEWRIPTPEVGPPLDAQSDLIERIAASRQFSATSMRSLCVEKVSNLADEWLKRAIKESDAEISLNLRLSYNVAQNIIETLESLQLQKQEAKQS